MQASIPLLAPEVDARLRSIYEEMMFLARRPDTTASMARAWYTHVAGGRLATKLRMFSGSVSKAAIAEEGVTWRLEHFKRIQTTLTKMIERHLGQDADDPDDFVRTIVECEQVHLVSFQENYAAMAAAGDYELAGIKLVPWAEVPKDLQQQLWKDRLRGRVANAAAFAPGSLPGP
jgi:hypothetical protein